MSPSFHNECMLLLTSERIYGYESSTTDMDLARQFREFINMSDDELLIKYYDEDEEYWYNLKTLKGFISLIEEYFSLRGYVLEDHPEWLI